jgi:hypothetical protein
MFTDAYCPRINGVTVSVDSFSHDEVKANVFSIEALVTPRREAKVPPLILVSLINRLKRLENILGDVDFEPLKQPPALGGRMIVAVQLKNLHIKAVGYR